jgi:hypothetical protein
MNHLTNNQYLTNIYQILILHREKKSMDHLTNNQYLTNIYQILILNQEKKIYGTINEQSVSHKYLSNTDSPSREKNSMDHLTNNQCLNQEKKFYESLDE